MVDIGGEKVLEIGKPVGKRGKPLPIAMLTESVPGKFYHISIETTGISDERAAVETITSRLYKEFRAEVVWIRVNGENIELQLQGSPFAWAALIPFIPTILGIIGITVVLVAVYSILAAIPGWAWGLLVVGGILVLIGMPSVTRAIKGEIKKAEREIKKVVR